MAPTGGAGYFALLITGMLLLLGCGPEKLSQTAFIFGTSVSVNLYDSGSAERFGGIRNRSALAFEAVFERLRKIEALMSRQLPDSEISNLNKASGDPADVRISSDTFFVIHRALEYCRISDGAFDISIGPLVSLWDIGGEHPRIPGDREISEALALVGYQQIILNEGALSVRLPTKAMAVDLGAVAKGYAADEAGRILREDFGIQSAVIDIGGNVLVLGSKSEGVPWRIGIQDPFQARGRFLGVIGATNMTVVTSGVYERFFETGGRRYHHILDSKTGYPAQNSLMSVTLVGRDSLEADALATAVFVMGLSRGYDLVESIPGVESVFVTRDKSVILTSGIGQSFHLVDSEFQVKNPPYSE